MTPLRTIALLTLLGGTSASGADAEGIQLTVENVRSDRGSVVVLVFDDPEAFNYIAHEWAVAYAVIPARKGTLRRSFPDLTEGPYAIFLFHDENDDLDVNFEGQRLLEGVGASGAPNPHDMPDFGAASVTAGPVTVPLHYDR